MGGTNDVVKKFREPGIADRVMSLLKFADKKPENLAIALGINRVGSWKRLIEEEMDRLIEECDLPLVKTVHGLNAHGERKQDTYVTYGLRRAEPELFVPAGQGPAVKVFTMDELKAKEAEVGKNQRTPMQLETELEKILGELSDPEIFPDSSLSLEGIKRRGKFSDSFFYSRGGQRKQKAEKALSAEIMRRSKLDRREEPKAVASSTPAEAGDEVDLAATLLSLQAQIEELRAENERLRNGQAGTPVAQGQEVLAVASLKARLESLEQAIESLTVEIKAAEGERDRLTQKRDAIQEVIELLR